MQNLYSHIFQGSDVGILLPYVVKESWVPVGDYNSANWPQDSNLGHGRVF